MPVLKWIGDLTSWLTLIGKVYLLLTPLIIISGFYFDYKIEKGVQAGLESVLEKNKEQDERISKLQSDHTTFKYQIRGILNHYHEDVNRFFTRGGGGNSSMYPFYVRDNEIPLRGVPYFYYYNSIFVPDESY